MSHEPLASITHITRTAKIMTSLLSWPPLPIPLTTQSRQSLTDDVDSPGYRHGLAIAAVESYLRLIAVPYQQKISAFGPQLYVEELGGFVACCPVSPDEPTCSTLPLDKEHYQGFLFVELSPPYCSANILGFVRQVTVDELPLSYLQPLSAFTAALAEASLLSSPVILLADWAAGLISGWLNPEEISLQGIMQSNLRSGWAMRSSALPSDRLYKRYAAEQADNSLVRSLSNLPRIAALTEIVEHSNNNAIYWQAAEELAYAGIKRPEGPVIKVKSLSDDLAGLAVALLVGIITKPDGVFLIGCQLYATGEQSELPEDIELKGIELIESENNSPADGRVFCELTPAVDGNPLGYLFTAEKGDRFNLQIHYQQKTSTNLFVLPKKTAL